ncbi:MAG: serine hydrolase [Paracoccaceae bacterium]
MFLVPVLAFAAPYADYVIDVRTGEVLHQENADTRLHPASLTKMMTLYIAFEAIERGEISLDTKVTISKHAASQPPSKLGLKAGQTIALRYLIRAAAIKSANDAATAIGEAIEGSEPAFAKRMTRTARALGMSKTTFANANGLTAKGHLSTAHDMTMLGRHLFYDYPEYYGLFSRTSADAGVAQVASTNRRFLGSYKGADGIKTGYTSAAGFNLVASAQRGNKRVIATVFGGKSTASRNARVAELLDMGFGKAPNRAIVQKPSRPVYTAQAGDYDDDVAKVVAEAVAGSRSLPAGKTIRLNVAVAKSLRPRARPLPGSDEPAEELLLAMQADINAALAEAQEIASDESSAATAAVEVASGTELPAVSDQPDAGEAGAADAPVFAQLTEPQPETLLAQTELQANPQSPSEPPVEEASFALASAIAPTESTIPAPAPNRAASTDPAAGTAETADVELAAATPPEAAETTLLTQPDTEPEPEQIVLASLSQPVEEAEELEVVTRISTSGGRQWAINVGHYPSRYNAERQLLQVALIEMSTLDEALRKVVSRKGGFDANFVGMTEEMANMACRRLQARQTECRVIGP